MLDVRTFRLKDNASVGPGTIEAVRLDPGDDEALAAIMAWTGGWYDYERERLILEETDYGERRVLPFDWIVKWPEGGFGAFPEAQFKRETEEITS